MARLFSIRPTWSLKGRRSQGLRGFTGKPFHPPLTDFPIVCYTLAAVFDLISYFSSPRIREDAGFLRGRDVRDGGRVHREPRRGAHRIHGLVEGDPRDRKSGPIGKAKHTQVWRTINWHATVMLTVTAITLIDIVMRVSDFDQGQTQGSWLILSLIAAAGVLFGAAYGGSLVFEYGFNVENVEEVWKESEEDHVRMPRGGSSS